jgi:O-antigen ligase
MNFTRSNGYLHWVLPAMLALVAAGTLLSGRDLSQTFLELQADTGVRGPMIVWGQRLVSVLLVLACAERVISHVISRKHLPSATLTLVYMVYWFASVAAPALFGSHPQIGHEYLYSLMLGFAISLAGARDRDRILDMARDALFAFIGLGVALIALMPTMVLDLLYSQGLLAGVPRFGGLAPHAVAMGMFAQTAILLVWARPYGRRWVNLLAWATFAFALFMAQSKTAWLAFLLCSLAMLLVRNGGGLWARITDPRGGSFGAIFCLMVMTAIGAVLGWVMVGDIGSHLDNFASTAQGAQLMSMTGRDQIWAIAMEEWQASPVFGYGPGLWDGDFRASIGMANATDAHNQFMDTLARAGVVGATALVLYAVTLLAMSLRYARATGGLSLALFLALAMRSISEVPLLLLGSGTELFTHVLLLVTLAGAAGSRVYAQEARPHYGFGVAS